MYAAVLARSRRFSVLDLGSFRLQSEPRSDASPGSIRQRAEDASRDAGRGRDRDEGQQREAEDRPLEEAIEAVDAVPERELRLDRRFRGSPEREFHGENLGVIRDSDPSYRESAFKTPYRGPSVPIVPSGRRR